MILVIHIFIAILSILATTVAYLKPSSSSLYASYACAMGTFISGLSLVIAMPAHLLQACISGVVYLSVVSIGIVAVRSRLARLQAVKRGGE